MLKRRTKRRARVCRRVIPCRLVFLVLSIWLLTVPALGQEQSPRPETTEQRRSPAEDQAETDADRGSARTDPSEPTGEC